jgi:hypothetical protein
MERVQQRIHEIRGQRVLLDQDLAQLYGVSTGRLNEAVRRNLDRFPEDFRFQLTRDELDDLKSHFAISSAWGGRRRSRPFAFTEQGVAMLSSVLRSPRAVRVNIAIMRVFVRLRGLVGLTGDLAHKLDALERKARQHDLQIESIFGAIRQLIAPRERPRRERIGFQRTR